MESFEVRKRALFDCLSEAESTLKGTNLDQSNNKLGRSDFKTTHVCVSNKTTSKLRGKDSIFAKPDQPITKCLKPRKEPDYKVNPHRWKKYSLADADISDRANSAAALTFLKEIAAQKEAQLDADADSEAASGKIVFNKPAQSKLKSVEDEVSLGTEKSELKGSKLVMPEYVIGQKVMKPKRSIKKDPTKTDSKTDKSHGIKLDHLDEEVDE